VAEVEDRVEVEPGGALVGHQQLPHRDALIPGVLGQLLDHPVGVVALGSGLDERQQDALGEQRAVGQLEVLEHAVAVDGHALDEADRAVLQVVDQDRRVRQHDPLDGGVRDVALVPERHILEPRDRVATQDAGETHDLLRLDRVALVGHRRGALLAAAERLLDLADLGALQVADLQREALEPGARKGDRAQQLGVAVAGDDLRRDVLALESEPGQHAPLEVGVGRRIGADRSGEGADRHLLEGRAQAAAVAIGLEREARQLDPERRRLGVHAVGATDAERARVLARAPRERRDELIRAAENDLAHGFQLQRQRGVEHIG
jgi:hypothetical protein